MNAHSNGLRICVIGGTGFVGTELIARLAAAGHFIRVPARVRSRGVHLLVLPTVELVVANVHEPRVLSQLLNGMDVVVNLVGILNEPGFGGAGFRKAHTELTTKIIEAAKRCRVRRLLHMSALGANAQRGPSHYLRTKGEAEQHIQRAGTALDATIFRPSLIFGPDDSLTNRFASLLRLGHGFMPLARAQARFAPVYVEDVVEAFVRALPHRWTYGETYELCGPQVMTLAEIVRFTARVARYRCHILPIPDFVARVQAAVMGLLPGKPFSLDNYKSLTVDNLCHENGFEKLGIQPRHMEAIVPLYLGPAADRFSRYRSIHSR
jgi:NADH dehydrogenase